MPVDPEGRDDRIDSTFEIPAMQPLPAALELTRPSTPPKALLDFYSRSGYCVPKDTRKRRIQLNLDLNACFSRGELNLLKIDFEARSVHPADRINVVDLVCSPWWPQPPVWARRMSCEYYRLWLSDYSKQIKMGNRSIYPGIDPIDVEVTDEDDQQEITFWREPLRCSLCGQNHRRVRCMFAWCDLCGWELSEPLHTSTYDCPKMVRKKSPRLLQAR